MLIRSEDIVVVEIIHPSWSARARGRRPPRTVPTTHLSDLHGHLSHRLLVKILVETDSPKSADMVPDEIGRLWSSRSRRDLGYTRART